MSSILLIDDDKALCRSLEIQFQIHKHQARSAHNVAQGYNLAQEFTPDLLLLDINLPDQDGISALPDFLKLHPRTPVIIMTAEPGNQSVVDAMSAGATDYIRKPFELEKVLKTLDTIENSRKISGGPGKICEEKGKEKNQYEMIGSHPQMIEVHKTLGLLARNRLTVLIQGESGTGKELAARILHDASTPDKPFVAINCSAVVPTLLESEFFGHEKGAFTGADKIKVGKMEYAADGTLFLDEIGDMPLDLQSKLLRVIQEGEFVRVGGLETIPMRARIVAATHHDLTALVGAGKFRRDLYYRLDVSSVYLPPLRDRRGDISHLVDFMLKKISKELGREVTSVTDKVLSCLIGYDWPGNIRELENVLTRSVALTNNSILDICDLDLSPTESSQGATGLSNSFTLVDAERHHVEKILIMNDWNITRSAQMLDISRTTLRKKIHDYRLSKGN